MTQVERVILIPNEDNQGQSLEEVQNRFEELLLDMAGGFTVENVSGAWRDDTGKVYLDTSKRYTVVSDKGIDRLIQLALPGLCLRARQECIFTSAHNVNISFVEAASGLHIGVGVSA